MASVYTMMAYQVESIFHVKSVYTLPWPRVSTLCRHEDLVVYIMMWHWVSTFWCHQRVDKVSTFWWHVSSLSSHLSSLWCHQAMSTFCSHTKCLPYEALPIWGANTPVCNSDCRNCDLDRQVLAGWQTCSFLYWIDWVQKISTRSRFLGVKWLFF